MPILNTPFRHFLFPAALALGLWLRMYATSYGEVWDVGAWVRAVGAIDRGNLYAYTAAYNYGPVWAYVLYVIRYVLLFFADATPHNFHIAISFALALADIANAWLLRRHWGIVPALLFYLCPVSIITTGYYCQFYTLALLPALIAFILLKKSEQVPGWRDVLIAAVLLGLSLSTKHFLIFFPIWLLLDRSFGTQQRLALCVLPYLFFFSFFLPFMTEPAAVEGISRNVFHFEAHGLKAFPDQLMRLLLPASVLHDLYRVLNVIPVFHGIKFIWAVLMCLSGWVVMRRFPNESLFFNIIAVVAFAPMMIEIYVFIAVIGCAVLWRYWAAWVYLAVGSFLILSNISFRVIPPDAFLIHVHRIIPWHMQNADMVHAQFWLFILLLCAWIGAARKAPAP